LTFKAEWGGDLDCILLRCLATALNGEVAGQVRINRYMASRRGISSRKEDSPPGRVKRRSGRTQLHIGALVCGSVEDPDLDVVDTH
jgi:hypothetical protein